VMSRALVIGQLRVVTSLNYGEYKARRLDITHSK
jgi:hypothetical protein